MPVIKYKKKIEKIFNKPVFGVEDLSKEGIPRNYAKKYLHELHKSETIQRVERNKYTTVDDPLIVASYLTQPCYISLWSAMSIHKLTTQIPFSVEIITSRKRFKRKIIFNETPLVFYTVQPQMMYGYENIIWKENIRIPIAKPEKIIIDALYLQILDPEELSELIDAANKPLLISYAKMTQKTTILKTIREAISC